MQSSSERVRLRQKRIITYFIEAADQIIKEKGVTGVTIRNVAELAGYTSATLYNYFDNLNHLIFLATMNYLEDYHAAIPESIVGCKDPVEVYLAISECFCKFSFHDPDVYELLFFSEEDKQEEYTKQYYDLFPEKIHYTGNTLSKIMPVNNIYSRSSIMLDDCVRAGLITVESASDFNDVAMMVYKCILVDVKEGRIEAEKAVAKTMRYYRQLMRCYTKPGCAV